MKVLGITTEGDGGAAVVEDGRVLSAINEERLCRMKLVVGFPRDSIHVALELANTDVGEIDAVIVAATRSSFVDQLEPFDGWFQQKPHGFGDFLKRQVAARLARYGSTFPALQSAYYALLGPTFAHRRRAIRRILNDEFGIRCDVRFVDHHFAHLTSAYYTSGFQDALLVSLDGGGDGRSALVYSAHAGDLSYVHEASAFNSLGNYYAYITHICGFKAQKHEGKITGLAASGEPKYVELLDEFITFRHGSLCNAGGRVFGGAVRDLEHRLPRSWTREDLAASIQVHCENVAVRFVSHWLRKTGQRDVALAGGVFANVRVNQEVHRVPGVDRVFIHPHMGDGGLCVGAALAACAPGVLPQAMVAPQQPVSDVYLGPDLSEESISAALRKHDLTPQRQVAPIEEEVADLLVEGHVVARAAGRMEYGPRALGNRSILYQPTDPTVNDWLNQNLRRTEFMPFAPATLYEERDRLFEGVAGAEHAAEFMTITFDCTDWARKHTPAVVHLDGTARPQLVRRDRNPGFYGIIDAFHRRTGLPAVINTSFNMHEEPIVCSADDCIRAFLGGNLDYLAIGPYLVKHPKETTRSLKPAPVTAQRLEI